MPLTVAAPSGAHFEFEEVKTNKGTLSLGDVPILVWDDVASALEIYGDAGISNILDGTSLRVSFQGIARRYKAAGKTDDEIATTQMAFRPGSRQGGVSTPVSRAARAARGAAESMSEEKADQLAELLRRVQSGEIDLAKLMQA